MTVEFLQGDCIEVMATLPAQSVHCVVTSPPYWGLRSYMPNAVQIKESLSNKEKEKIIKELTIMGIDGTIR